MKIRTLPIRLLTTWQWMTIIGFLISGSVGIMAYAFSKFDSLLPKAEHEKFVGRIDQRLERMDNKLDRIMERVK